MPEIAKENNERLKEITDKLERGIKELFEGEKFKEYLKSMSKFHNYSFNNTLLIAMQKPDASLVASFNSWKNKFGRHVNKNEKGIKILAPAPFKVQREEPKIDDDTGLPLLDRNGRPIVEEIEVTIPHFKTVTVFDVSQTNGKELPQLGADELNGAVKNYEKFFEALKSVSPVPIEFEKILDGSKGYYHHGEKRIAVNEGMSETQNIKTAIHEICHAKLHDKDLIKADLAVKKDRKTGEVESESIAYTVCQHYGIDTSHYSFAYIAAWGSGKDTPELKNSLETIRSTASEIINKIDEIMLAKIKEKSQEQGEKTQVEKSENSSKSSNIIGNTKYADIADKNYFKLETKVALEVAAKLESEGVSFSGRTSKEHTTLTIGAADVDKFRAIEKSVKSAVKDMKKEPAKTVETTTTPNYSTLNPQSSPIIGNTKYVDIADKKYFKIDARIAEKVAAELEKRGVKFSGRIGLEKTTLTIGNADVGKYRAVYNSVKTAESELKSAEKMPDKTYTYSIYQVNDDNKDLRFATLKSLGEREVNFADYDLVYSAEITANGRIKAQVLEDIYTAFNVEHPADFKGRSLSISDVVVMENDGEQTAHYCDNIGFFEVENFFEKRAVAVAEKPENPKEISKKVPSISEKLKAVQKPVVATKSEFPVVYVNDLNFAREHDEVEAWKISKTLNIECAAAIDEAIRANSKPGPVTGTQYVDTEKALKDVAGKFGIERVSAVTAAIVANQDWDGRLSQTNKNWAKGFEHPQNKVYVQTHLTIFDGFVNKVRNFEKILDKKPSISEQLQAKKPDITVKNDGVKRNKGDVDL